MEVGLTASAGFTLTLPCCRQVLQDEGTVVVDGDHHVVAGESRRSDDTLRWNAARMLDQKRWSLGST